jgi:hypothetical protein
MSNYRLRYSILNTLGKSARSSYSGDSGIVGFVFEQPKDTWLSEAARAAIIVSRVFMLQLVKGFY